jgi:hypothetical protein
LKDTPVFLHRGHPGHEIQNGPETAQRRTAAPGITPLLTFRE